MKTACLDVCVVGLHVKKLSFCLKLLLFLLKSSKVPTLACFFIEFDDVLESND